jgi:hypothetical protein
MRILSLVAVTVLSCGFAAVAVAQKPKPKPKPGLGSIGTQQMPGAVCKVGQAYTLGNAKGNAINVALIGVEYKATRVKVDKFNVWPNADRKLVVIRYTIHNPLPKEQRYSGTIKWTVVSPKAENVETQQAYLDDGSNAPVDQVLKPAQKLAVFSVVEVAGRGEMDKLIAANTLDAGSAVARYPLAGVGKKIEAPYADPADSSGATHAQIVTGQLGTVYEVGDFDVTVVKVETVTDQVDEIDTAPPAEDKAYAFVTFKVTNKNREGFGVVSFETGWLSGTVIDEDGGACGTSNSTYRSSSFEAFNPSPTYDQTVTFRKVFVVSRKAKLDAVKLKDNASHELIVKL